jgi:hypothetical protein
MPFETNVFINCPFDTQYTPLLRPLLFTVIFVGLEPKISETADSGQQRVNLIQDLILSSKYSIHDLSRVEARRVRDLPRFNMPFELGLDIGCKNFGSGVSLKSKRCLILEKDQYRYQRILSDISGNDIAAHNENAETLILRVRGWFFTQNIPNVPVASKIWNSYNEFESYIGPYLVSEGYRKIDIDEMPKSEFIAYVKEWVNGIRTR